MDSISGQVRDAARGGVKLICTIVPRSSVVSLALIGSRSSIVISWISITTSDETFVISAIDDRVKSTTVNLTVSC